MKRIAIASDHAGLEGKEAIKQKLASLGVEYEDLGTHSSESVDYPDYAERVAHAVVNGEAERGILVCGSGIGMQIAANKVPGIRAALVWNAETARLCREHNDANIVAVGARTTAPEVIDEIVEAYLGAQFQGGRHAVRIDKVAQHLPANRRVRIQQPIEHAHPASFAEARAEGTLDSHYAHVWAPARTIPSYNYAAPVGRLVAIPRA